MSTNHCLIDSNIWYYAYIVPKKEEFVGVHEKASTFLSTWLADDSLFIAMTLYQIAEIMDLLRKGGLPKSVREDVFEGFTTTKFLTVGLDLEIVKLCFRKSLSSGIHIYDYLVALPLKGVVTDIFSADDHFQHEDFQEIAKVTNPLSPWILREGRLPIKESRS